MKVVFRFKGGFRKIENWDKSREELRPYYKFLHTEDLFSRTWSKPLIDPIGDEFSAKVYTFELKRTFIDEDDIETAIYDCDEKLI